MLKTYSTGKIRCQILHRKKIAVISFKKRHRQLYPKREIFLGCESNVINQTPKLKKKVTYPLFFYFYFIDPVFLFF